MERSADYRLRMGPSSDSDQDDDTISISGRSEWEYPTVKSNIGNYATIKAISSSSNTISETQIPSNTTVIQKISNNGVSIISVNGNDKMCNIDDNLYHNHQNSTSSSSTNSSSGSIPSSSRRSVQDSERQNLEQKSFEQEPINYSQTNDFNNSGNFNSVNITHYSNNTRNMENNSQQHLHYQVRLHTNFLVIFVSNLFFKFFSLQKFIFSRLIRSNLLHCVPHVFLAGRWNVPCCRHLKNYQEVVMVRQTFKK